MGDAMVEDQVDQQAIFSPEVVALESGHDNSEEVHITVDDYIQELLRVAGDSDGNGIQQHLATYYGEFYDYNPEQDYYGEGVGQAAMSRENSEGESVLLSPTFEGDTVASTATYLSSVSVQSIRGGVGGLQLEDFIVDIPFREQDDPPDELLREAASLESDSENER